MEQGRQAGRHVVDKKQSIRHTVSQRDVQIDRQTEMHGWMGGWMNGQMDGWKNG